ncbi:Rne/Rng family ribonuclease [Microvirga lotononidis]|uniref:Ribonuclease E n=1 Tax=Microvirga lotononidis TaxID=864069 RepID=I4YZS7_9HYPH|nr:ribonuclease E/G [Microvirga lotononidis]EIM29469.1 ribonuclease, Rne/Rng family [Microvirga lotononidis]WQO27212.1 ribonuclease E/G [Microvirga lotononidis]
MANKMLIDASHPEETRVVVVRGQKVEEFDFESANRKQLRGNIYLAKVTRVEPSLQAAFVEYGGNRHGFLAFSEIHPDYYQIPVADRQALLEAEAEAQAEEEREEERRSNRRRRRSSPRRAENDETVVSTEAEAGTEAALEAVEGSAHTEAAGEEGEAPGSDTQDAVPLVMAGQAPDEGAEEAAVEAVEGSAHVEAPEGDEAAQGDEPAAEADARAPEGDTEADEDEEDEDEDDHDVEEHEIVEQLGGDDAIEDLPQRRRTPRKQYKIQEVIKRRQILLVQVVKEERGNKGAALTTYLSLAGRYSVLMPNTGRGGGISRKITNAADRKRLKEIAQELEVPEGMGIILRTAGASRTKPEIKRDYEYLMRLWESVRELTLKSAAPALVYEEGSLIKRAIRDLYNKDIDDVMVAGEEGYREAKDFMRMLMPSHSKLVQPYRDPQPLFAKFGVEAQLDAMFSNVVTLKSGGYLVINPTEALVSIDVNSGRSTREHNIEDTALRTNLEAAEEIARQLRLRDLAGLVVIDFIDMEEKRNNRAVEKKLNECLKNDRARIQVGRISPFGLLEMSRQRIRTGVLESSSIPCPHCAGTGFVRSTPSVALQVLRSIEETLIKNSGYNLVVRTRMEAAFYILNQKRIHLRELETRFGVAISIVADDSLHGTTTYAIERGEPALKLEHKSAATGIQIDAIAIDEPVEEIEVETEEEATEEAQGSEERGEEGEGGGRRRRRRRRRRGRDREGFAGEAQGEEGAEAGEAESETDEEEAEVEASGEEAAPVEAGEADEESRGGRRRRRGRRGGRGRGRDETTEEFALEEGFVAPDQVQAQPAPEEAAPAEAVSETSEPRPTVESEPIVTPERPVAEAPVPPPAPVAPEPEPVAVVLTPPDPERPKRAGWWSKAKSVLSGS